MKVGRNAPCPCGSGKKYKRCCWEAAQFPEAKRRDAEATAREARKAALTARMRELEAKTVRT